MQLLLPLMVGGRGGPCLRLPLPLFPGAPDSKRLLTAPPEQSAEAFAEAVLGRVLEDDTWSGLVRQGPQGCWSEL